MIPLETVIDAISGRRLLVVGDVMLDRFIYGEVRRISPEAPVPVIRMDAPQDRVGGAGNVARNIVALGAHCDLVGVIGRDDAGGDIAAALADAPALSAHLIVCPERRTTLKTRFVANLHATHLLRADREDTHPISTELEDRVIAAAEACLPTADAVLLSDYAKGVLTERVLRTIIAAARAQGRPVIVDPKSADLARYAGADVLTPNLKELAEATNAPVPQDETAIVAAACSVAAATGCGAVLVTRGEQGITVVPREGEAASFGAAARRVVDVSGAGDTVLAAFSLALAAGSGLVHAAYLANVAAGIAVAKPGTAEATADELRREVLQRPHFDIDARILPTHEAAAAAVLRWRREGLVVGFTNGCFDLLHPGHIALLAGARAQCDRLVVGLNSDASVTRLKGPARPVQPEAARATVLAALRMVDGLVVFDEDTPLALIERLAPDVLIKGADYTLDQVVGRDVVEAHGGRVCLIDLVPDASTSRIVATIAEAGSGDRIAGSPDEGGPAPTEPQPSRPEEPAAPPRLPISVWLLRPAGADETERMECLAQLCRAVVPVDAEAGDAQGWRARLLTTEADWVLPVEGALPDAELVDRLYRRAGPGIGLVSAGGSSEGGVGLYAAAALRHCLDAFEPVPSWSAFRCRAEPILRRRPLEPGADGAARFEPEVGRTCWIVVREAAEGADVAEAYRRLGDLPRIVTPALDGDPLAELGRALLRAGPALVHCLAADLCEWLADRLAGTRIDLVVVLDRPLPASSLRPLLPVARLGTASRAISQAVAEATGIDLPVHPADDAGFCRFVRAAGRRICCVLGGGIGNMIQNTPALRRLADHLGLTVDLVLVQDYPDCATLFVGAPGIGTVALVGDLAASIRYDLVVILDAFTADPPRLNADLTLSAQEILPRTAMQTMHEAEYYLKVLQLVLDLPYDAADAQRYFLGAAVGVDAAALPHRIGIHAGCKPGIWDAKKWPFFEELVRGLATDGYEPVCFGGPGEAVPGALDRTGLPLAETIAEIGRCAYFVSNDSGLMHVADALGVPLTSLFGPTSIVKNRPLSRTSQVIGVDLPCAPCQFRWADLAACTCIRTLDLAQVREGVQAHMRRLGLRVPSANLVVASDPEHLPALREEIGGATLIPLAVSGDGFPSADDLAALAERLRSRTDRPGIVVLSSRIAYSSGYLAALARAWEAGGGADVCAGTVTYNPARRAFQHAAGDAGSRTVLACTVLGCFSLDTLLSARDASTGGGLRILTAATSFATAAEAGGLLDHAAVEALLNAEGTLSRAEHGVGFAAGLASYRDRSETDRLRDLATGDYPAERILADYAIDRFDRRLVETLLRAGAVPRAGAIVADLLARPEAVAALEKADFEALLSAAWEVGSVEAFVEAVDRHLDAVLRSHPASILRLLDAAAAILEPGRLNAFIERATDTILSLDDPENCLVLINAVTRHADPATLVAVLRRIDASAYSDILSPAPTFAHLHGREWVLGLLGEALDQEPRARFTLPRTGLSEANFPARADPRRPMRRAILRAIRDGDRGAFIEEVNAVLRHATGAHDLWRLLRSHTHAIRQLGLRCGDIAYGTGEDDLALAVVLDDHATLTEAAQQGRMTPELTIAWRSRMNDYGPLDAHLATLLGGVGLAPVRIAGAGIDAVLRSCLDGAPLPTAPDRGKISVILCAHDPDPELLRLAVASVLRQSYRNLELIVVDDGGPETRRSEFERFAAEDDRVRLLRNPVNGGPYRCRNMALEIATGTYVAFQDADDVAHPQRLAFQVFALLREPSCVACYGQHMRFDRDGGLQFEINPDRLNLQGDGPITALIRREALDAVGGFAPVRSRGDIDMRDRLEKCFGVHASLYLPIPLMFCSGGPASLSNTMFSRSVEQIRVFRFGSRKHAWPPVESGAFVFAPVGVQPVPFVLRSATPRAGAGPAAAATG